MKKILYSVDAWAQNFDQALRRKADRYFRKGRHGHSWKTATESAYDIIMRLRDERAAVGLAY